MKLRYLIAIGLGCIIGIGAQATTTCSIPDMTSPNSCINSMTQCTNHALNKGFKGEITSSAVSAYTNYFTQFSQLSDSASSCSVTGPNNSGTCLFSFNAGCALTVADPLYLWTNIVKPRVTAEVNDLNHSSSSPSYNSITTTCTYQCAGIVNGGCPADKTPPSNTWECRP